MLYTQAYSRTRTVLPTKSDSDIIFCLQLLSKTLTSGPPGVLGIWGEWLFIFRELGSTGNYFRGAREQAHSFGDIGSLAKRQKKKKKLKASILFEFLKIYSAFSPQTPLVKSKCIYFRTNMLIKIDLREKYGN